MTSNIKKSNNDFLCFNTDRPIVDVWPMLCQLMLAKGNIHLLCHCIVSWQMSSSP